jgi:uncharacterized coiled-coil protein SlyX
MSNEAKLTARLDQLEATLAQHNEVLVHLRPALAEVVARLERVEKALGIEDHNG